MSDPTLQPGAPKPAADFSAMSGHMVRGSAWMIAMRWGMRCIGLVSTVILARLLTPGDYGIVAMAVIVVGFLQIFTFTTFDLALIQNKEEGREFYDTAWTLQVLQHAALGLALILVAPFGASYFGEPAVENVVRVLALGMVLEGFVNIGIVNFRKDLEFAKEFRLHAYVRVINLFVMIGLAVTLRSYWALVGGQVAEALLRLILSYVMHPYRPRLSLSRTRAIWSFSQWMLLFLIGSYLKNKIDVFVVGRVGGTAAMGSYHVASDLSAMPTNELVMPLGRALFPSYAKLADNRAEAARAFESVFGILVLVCLPLGFGLAAVAHDLVLVVLGEKWRATIPLMQLLAISAVMAGLSHAIGIYLSATGRVRINAIIVWLNVVMLIPGIWVGLKLGEIEGIAAARMAVSGLFLILLFGILAHSDALRWDAILRTTWRPALATAVMVAALWPLSFEGMAFAAVRLALGVLIGAAAFVLASGILWYLCGRPPGAESTLIDAGLRGLRKLRRERKPT